MKPIDQLNEWVNGNPLHNHEFNACCPDYSCCMGEICMAELEERREFRRAYLNGQWLEIQTMLELGLAYALRVGLKFEVYKEEKSDEDKTRTP